MAPDTRFNARPVNDILAQMEREGYRFNFFQAVRLLEQQLGGDGNIRFRPDQSLAFPPADIRQIEFDPDAPKHVRLTLTFMGLYGVDAPVPDFIPEKALSDAVTGPQVRDFLDVFSHRLYSFFYRSWKRMRPEVDGTDRNERRYFALAGMAGSSAAGPGRATLRRLLSLAGLIAPRTRGAKGLQTLLTSVLDLPVRIEENVPRWVHLGRRTALGRRLCLDGSSMLGERAFDVSGKFRLWLGPMDIERYRTLLPGEEGADELHSIVRTYVPGMLDYDLALQLHTEQMPPARLADPACRLGLSACLGRPLSSVITRVVGGTDATRRTMHYRPSLAA